MRVVADRGRLCARSFRSSPDGEADALLLAVFARHGFFERSVDIAIEERLKLLALCQQRKYAYGAIRELEGARDIVNRGGKRLVICRCFGVRGRGLGIEGIPDAVAP